MLNLKSIAYPLPEDVENARRCGCYDMANLLIDNYLANPDCPEVLKERLLLEKHNLKTIKTSFPYTIEEADNLLSTTYPGQYIKGSLSENLINGNLAWRFIDGRMMVESRVVEDARKRLAGFKESQATISNLKLRDDNISYMKEHKERTAIIRLRSSIKPLMAFGSLARINIPVVRDSDSVSDIKFTLASKGYKGVDDKSVMMRCAHFEKTLEENDEFFIEYSYKIKANYKDIKETKCEIDRKKFSEFLKEESPHILFTPYLKALANEIVGTITSPSEKARAIYNWITTHVKYSFMREYSTIENIPEFAASNLKGDCGVQAMLFITLSRISGIPAKWQSGLYVTKESASPHDWAEFYLPEYGWCFCDCSFGGAAYRSGNIERWKYYFGSGDVFRAPFNDMCCQTLYGKEEYPSDPTDNQRGEIEIKGRSLERSEMEWKADVLDFELPGENE